MKKTTSKQPPGFTILSIDWDYFLPRSIDAFDWGHSENGFFFHELVWFTRADARPYVKGGDKLPPAAELIKVDPERVAKFLGRIWRPSVAPAVCVCDSHKDIVQWTLSLGLSKFNVINFDAHHDVHYNHDGKARRVGVLDLDCGNWVSYLRAARRLQHYTLVYPEWRKIDTEGPKLPEGIDRVIYGDWPDAPITTPFVFLCRSSCWMPPWCDPQFSVLRNQLTKDAVSVSKAPYAMKERPWSDDYPRLNTLKDAMNCATQHAEI